MSFIKRSPVLVTASPGSGKTLYVMSNYSKNTDSVVFYSGIKGVNTSLRWLMIPQHAVENIGLWVWCYKNNYPVGKNFFDASPVFMEYQQTIIDFDLMLDSKRSRAESSIDDLFQLNLAISEIEDERLLYPLPPTYDLDFDLSDYLEVPLKSRRKPSKFGRYTVIVDEVQRIFPTRNGAKPIPSSLSYLQTARHDSIDFVFITQSTTLIDSALLALVSTYIHLDRRFGFSGAWVYESSTLIPQYPGKDINKTFFKYDKSNYSLYRSAESHASSFKIPFVVYYVIAGIIFLASILYYLYDKKTNHAVNSPAIHDTVDSYNSPSLPSPSQVSKDKKIDWVKDTIPAIRGLPYTAPIYADIARPVSFPVVSGCVSSKAKCDCYTQQGTKVDMSPDLCRAMVKQSSFNMFKKDKYSKESNSKI